VDSRRRARQSGRRARYLGAASLVIALAAFVAIPGGASASSVTCGGKLKLDKTGFAGPHGVDYAVKCDEDIQAYSVIVSKRIDYFQPDPTPFMPNGTPSSTDHFSCEGPIPGDGFGCPGAMTAGNTVKGQFATIAGACNPTVFAWVTVTTQQLTSTGTPFETSSQPYRLTKPKGCTTTAAAHRRAHRRHRAHHRAHRRA
jgi:hypothetical protein